MKPLLEGFCKKPLLKYIYALSNKFIFQIEILVQLIIIYNL